MTKAVTPTSVEASVAGFIVWLARQRPSDDERQHCPERVQRSCAGNTNNTPRVASQTKRLTTPT
jgi:hypothetical protein